MKNLIEFPTEGGDILLVEVNELDERGGTVRASREPGELADRASMTFEMALHKVAPAAERIINILRSMSQYPDEISVEFGINLSAEVGAVIASTGAEANFTVSMTWKSERADGNPYPH